MNKLTATLVLIIGFSFSSLFAQKILIKDIFEDLSDEERSEVHLENMKIDLDLTSSQIEKIRPLVIKQVHKNREIRKTGQILSKQERLDNEKAFDEKLKPVLTEQQYLKFLSLKKNRREMKPQKHKRSSKLQ